MDQYLSSPVIWVPLVVVGIINLWAFIMVGVDKHRSAQDHQRVPEVYFFLWAIFFAGLGVLLGMLIFHHKTRKWSFIFGISCLTLQQLLLIYFLVSTFIK